MRHPVSFLLVSSVVMGLASGCSRAEPKGEAAPAVSAPEKPAPEAPAPASVSATNQAVPSVAAAPAELLPALQAFAAARAAEFASIPEDRRLLLDKLALFLRARRDSGETAKVVFICTHNSRRSHLSQISASLAAAHYGLDRIEAFSGGTEATAFNPRAVAALERLGYAIQNPGGDNPHYQVTFASNRPPIEAFSKKYDDPHNPKDGFVAVMTCDHADKNCPTVAGAALRIPLHYVDPKVSDGTPAEAATYDERAKQIATELFYAMSRVKA